MILFRYHDLSLHHRITAPQAKIMITAWPVSMPILKQISDSIRRDSGIPTSWSAEAKPQPWISPKRKISSARHQAILFSNMFSIATKTMESAIMHSVKFLSGLILPVMVSMSVSVCERVNSDACHKMLLILGLEKNKARIKRIWSKPEGRMCVNPSE